LRLEQWIKNLLIFAPLIFAFQWQDSQKWALCFQMFFAFCFISSVIYVINDYCDRNTDKNHPVKRFRPFASGELVLKDVVFVVPLLMVLGFFLAGIVSTSSLIILAIYFILNLLYSFWLKHLAIVDVFIVAFGFILRLYAGGESTGIALSHWILLMTFLLALFIALAKRRDDVILHIQGKDVRKVIDGYSLEFVNASMVLMAAVVMVSYIQYTVSDAVVQRLQTDQLYLTSIFVLFGLLRYMQLTFVEEKTGNPTKVFLTDLILQLNFLAWLAAFIAIVKWA
jgi:4-hydroxybenzoate polyprenyltransferase